MNTAVSTASSIYFQFLRFLLGCLHYDSLLKLLLLKVGIRTFQTEETYFSWETIERKFYYFNILFFQILNLADNELSELIDGAIEKLHNLVELDLSSNLLDFVPNTLDYLGKNLKILKLSNNLIFHLDDKSFLGKYFIE